jgi:Ca2+/H+ antiporter
MIAPRREGKEVLLLNAASTTMLLLLCTFLTGVITELLVGRIAKLRQFGSSGGASEAWFALILLPIVGNAGLCFKMLKFAAI